jgi:hypothetical protein
MLGRMSELADMARAVRLLDGLPDVSQLPCDRLLDGNGSEYMVRYYREFGFNRSARFHHIMASDPGRAFHDHPWDFVSRLLEGTYTEHTPQGSTRYEAPCVIVRKAEQLHRLELPDGPVWSHVLTGRLRREWGFQDGDEWWPYLEYPGAGTIAGCQPPDSAVRPSARRRRMIAP